MITLVETPIDTAAVVAAVAAPTAGGLATFMGTTRNHNDGRSVLRLSYEAYPEMALAEMQRIAERCQQRWDIIDIAMVHRLGVVPVGEVSVMIAVASVHRGPAFDACRFAIDRLKEIVPIWKKEYYEDGEVWIGAQCTHHDHGHGHQDVPAPSAPGEGLT